MNTLADIEAAAESLPTEQKEKLLRFLTERLHGVASPAKARLVRCEDDVLLQADESAPPMTPENIRQMLEDWP